MPAKNSQPRPFIHIGWPSFLPNGTFRRGVLTILSALVLSQVAAGVYGNITGNVPPSPDIINIFGNNNRVQRDAELKCPDDWLTTAGREPDSGSAFIACTSPDSRYVFHIASGTPSQVLDTKTGEWKLYSEVIK